MNDSNPTIQISELNHHFGRDDSRTQVLRNVTLDILPGQIVMLTGPSGAGKTTLLTVIGGLRTVQDGSMRVLSQDYAKLNRKGLVRARKRIGFIFQAHNLFSSLTAFQNVRMALELHSHGRKEINTKVESILTRLGLQDRMNYKPDNLSGGQKQRVAVARALVNSPGLVLADEPTAALDEQSATDVMSLLKELAHDMGSTVVMVTHDDRMMVHADRIIRMVDGAIDKDESI